MGIFPNATLWIEQTYAGCVVLDAAIMPIDTRRIALADFAADPVQVFEDVVRTRTSIIVEGKDGARAVLQPAGTTSDSGDEQPGPSPTPEEVQRAREGIRRASGRWKGLVDAEQFEAYLRGRRKTANRPSVRL